MTNNKDVELQVLPDLEHHVVIDNPISSTVAVIVIILLQGPLQDQSHSSRYSCLDADQIDLSFSSGSSLRTRQIIEHVGKITEKITTRRGTV